MNQIYKILTLLGLAFQFGSLSAQTPFCISHELMEKDSAYYQSYQKINQSIYKYAEQFYNNPQRGSLLPAYTLPVVVHLIVPPGTPIGKANNLSDAQVEAGLDLLNQSFANQGAFKTVDGVDMNIQFCLARRDPNGLPTNGITRDESILVAETTPCTPFGTNSANDGAIKKLNNWDCRKYINIWLVTDLYNANFGCGLAGYAYFPGAGCAVDGIVQESRYWITAGGTRVTAHEFGHYFSLNHTFSGGCNNANCLLDGDQICDTPPDNSPSFAACNTNSCATDSPDLPDDNSNYMDYTSCSPPHFTAGQKVRALVGLEQGRSSLITSNGCQVVANTDLALLGVDMGKTGCSTSFSPLLTIKNSGLQTITSFTVSYSLNGTAPVTIPWTGSLSANASVAITIPTQILPLGNYTFTVTILNPNGFSDEFASDNSFSSVFNIFPSPQISLVKVLGTHCISDGIVSVKGSGGVAPYLYDSPGNGLTQNDGLFKLLLAGNQRFIISDSNNCQDTIDVLVPDSCAIQIPNQFVINGDANYLGGDCYRLTPAVTDAGGSVWYNKKIDLTKDFIAEFDMNLGCIDANGADGIAFVLQPISTAIGNRGGGLGYAGIQPSVVVEFDTWRNCCNNSTSINSPEANDPVQDHVAIMKNGTTNHLSINNLAGPVDILPGRNAEDCSFHSVRVSWNATQQRLNVIVDCLQRLSYQGDIVNTIFNKDPNVYFGFTAATGGAINVHQICLKYISFLDKIPDATICEGGSIQMSAPSDFVKYDWTPTTGVSNPALRNPVFSPVKNTSYIVAMTNQCGNTIRDTVDVKVVNLDLDVDTTILNPCSAFPILKLSAKSSLAGVDYAINSSIFSSSNLIFEDYQYRFGSLYLLYARLGNCTISRKINVTAPKPLRDSLIFQQAEFCGAKGSVQIHGIDGKAPYEYKLDAGPYQPSGNFFGLNAGTYTLSIRDARGCTLEKQINIANSVKTISLKMDSSRLEIDCFNDKAFAAFSASGTNPFYYFSLDKQKYSYENIFNNLSAGKHVVVARDDYGCTSDTIPFVVISHITKEVRTDTIKRCFGQTYTINGKIYTVNGVYFDTLKTRYGCDSVVITRLKIESSLETTLTKSICFGESIRIGNSVYVTSGKYADLLKSREGCDSLVNLDLTVKTKKETKITAQLCSPKNYILNNVTYTSTGIYVVVLQASDGCDSTITLDLTINSPSVKQLDLQLCSGESVVINQKTYAQAGSYSDTLFTAAGCDSIININLVINPVKKTTISRQICQGDTFTLNGKGYSSTGTYFDTLLTTAGCDSVLEIYLVVHPKNLVKEVRTICENESIVIRDSVITKAGQYQFTLKNKFGCDSIYQMDLTVLDTTSFYQEYVLCDGDTLRLGNRFYASSGKYAQALQSGNGCDSTLYLTIKRGKTDYCDDKYCRLYIPNIFSPNGDMQNDYFEVYSPVVSISRLQIFDRWGDLQYDEISPNPKWDGNSASGGQMNSGVYVFVLYGTCSNKKPFIKKGDLTLIR
ncbi:MAG: lectin-like domain-containing protein [Saprospiraceae bacterium]